MRIGLAPLRIDTMDGGVVGYVETALNLHDAGYEVWLGVVGPRGPIWERLSKAPFIVLEDWRAIATAMSGTDILFAPAEKSAPLKEIPAARKVPFVIVTMWTMGFSVLRRFKDDTGFPFHAIWVDSYLAGKHLDKISALSRQYWKLYSPIPLHPARFERQYDVAEMKRKLGLKTRLVMGNVARHVGAKGISHMIRLWKSIPEEASLLLVGGGMYHSNFKNEAGGQEQVVFPGPVGDGCPYLACMDVFLHLPISGLQAHRLGTVALAPCEATMIGVPVVGTKGDFGWSEQFEDRVTGFVVDRWEDAKEPIRLLLRDDKLRAEMGHSALDFSRRKNLQWRDNLLQFVELLAKEI